MNKIASLNAGMLKLGPRRPPTKPLVLAPGQAPVSAYQSQINTLVEEARAEIGYHREGFIRVEHPDHTNPRTLMGRHREKIPSIENDHQQ